MNPLALSLLGDGVRAVLDRLFPDPMKRAQVEIELRKLEQEGTFAQKAEQALALAQIDVNKTEAATGRGGWRTFIGWNLGAAMSVQFVVGPLGVWAAGMAGYRIDPPPMLDAVLWQLMFGMLGLGGLKTFEKVKGAR